MNLTRLQLPTRYTFSSTTQHSSIYSLILQDRQTNVSSFSGNYAATQGRDSSKADLRFER